FNDTATTEIYTLSLHDALPISVCRRLRPSGWPETVRPMRFAATALPGFSSRSEEHTSELQSHSDIVCRPLLEKKNSPRRSPKPRHSNPCGQRLLLAAPAR